MCENRILVGRVPGSSLGGGTGINQAGFQGLASELGLREDLRSQTRNFIRIGSFGLGSKGCKGWPDCPLSLLWARVVVEEPHGIGTQPGIWNAIPF